ncbi:MAG: hypothetical protein U9O18_00020 [Chloroflexota bacterium]|nr:hypothetical protein [Chloroflexota bacterium]
MADSIRGTRAAFMRMFDAHKALLRAELEITGKELGIIVALAVGALVLAILVGILLYVGSFLFFGELLFGSMGWGIIHGTLLGGAVIGFAGINLAGGDVRAYGWGALIGVIVAVLLSALLLSNVGNEAAEWGSRLFGEQVPASDLPFGEEWVATLVGLAVGALIMTLVAFILGWRADQRGRALTSIVVVGAIVGGFVGAIYASTRYDSAAGVLGLAIMLGLIAWIVAGVLLVKRKGFDTEARYANLVPRESIASFEKTKDFLMEQWEQQKGRMLGR